MSDKKEYPERIMRVLRQRKGLDKNDTSDDSILQGTQSLDALREMCAWSLGDPMWADTFISWANACGMTVEIEE